MKVVEIKNELHRAIDIIEDKDFLKAVSVLVSEKAKEYEYDLSDEDKAELDKLKEIHKLGKNRTYSVEEVKTAAYSKIKK